MTFKIFHKTGELRDSQGDWDGDDGEYEEIELPDEKVNKALAEIIYDSYFKASIPYIEHSNDTNVARIQKQIAKLVSDCDLEEKMRECFADELNEWAQGEYADEA